MPSSETYPRTWRWPGGERIAMSVGLAFEAFEFSSQFTTRSAAGTGAKKPNYLSLSFADYGWKAGFWRLRDTLGKYGIKANMSANGLAAESHPEVVRAAVEAGFEVNGHGWVNDHVARDDDPEAEAAEIRRCTEVLTEASGGVRPVGWTGPGSAGSKNTLAILKSEGYIWNGDDASDDLPFLRESGKGPMVIMPRTNVPHNDLAMWLAPRNPPGIILECFRNSFDTLYAEGSAGAPRWIEMTLHCHIGGRPTLQPEIRKVIEYAKSHDAVWFARRRDIAEWALKLEGGATK